MKKAISIAVVIAVCLTLALSLTVSAAKADKSGPAEKATGSVHAPMLGNWYVEFNAHEEEEIDGLPVGKGTMKHWNDEQRVLEFEVKYVVVEGDTAWFAAQCNTDTDNKKVHQWVFVKVLDGGEPGVGVDYVGWNWPSPDVEHPTAEAEAIYRVKEKFHTGWWIDIDEGNLQVHTR